MDNEKKNVPIMINALKENQSKREHSALVCHSLSRLTLWAILSWTFLPWLLWQHALPGFLLFLNLHLKDRLVFFRLALDDCFCLFSPHTFSNFIATSLLLPPKPVCQSSWLPLWQFHLDDPKPALPHSATPPRTRVPKTNFAVILNSPLVLLS